MLILRRGFRSCKLPTITTSIQKQTSIGKLLQTTHKSCARRNNVLGKHFCRFAVRLKQYTETINDGREINLNHLKNQFDDLVSRLDLKEPTNRSVSHIKLQSTGQLLSSTIQKSLDKWKCSAHNEIREVYRNTHQMSDESITENVREINYSLIGWYLQTYGMQNTFAFIEWLGIPLFSDPDNPRWTQPKSLLVDAFNDETKRKLNQLLDGYESLEHQIKYRFRNRGLFLQSVSHESFSSNDITGDYHGLDFMGDAILNYAIVRHLFRHPVHLDADELSDLSTLLYSNSSIATVAVRNDLHTFLRYTTPELRDNINSFVAFLRRNKFKPVDDIYFLDKKNFVFEVPPIIPSSFEALVAAIYFDSQMDLNVVSNTITYLMRPDIRSICEKKPKTAYAVLDQLDSKAIFSSPEIIAAGQVKVDVMLPKYSNKRFSAVSRDPSLAKWGAAKSAIIQIKNQKNVFIPTKQKSALKRLESIH